MDSITIYERMKASKDPLVNALATTYASVSYDNDAAQLVLVEAIEAKVEQVGNLLDINQALVDALNHCERGVSSGKTHIHSNVQVYHEGTHTPS